MAKKTSIEVIDEQDIIIEAERQAAEDLGMTLTAQYVLDIRAMLREKSLLVDGKVQFYAIKEDKVWANEKIDDRIFAALRLLYDYQTGSGGLLDQRIKRIDDLKDLILRLVTEKKAAQEAEGEHPTIPEDRPREPYLVDEQD